jgi:hypothetical protein
VPPILSALGASPATLRAAILDRYPAGQLTPPKSQLIPLAKSPADHACPRSQITLFGAALTTPSKSETAAHTGGSSRAYHVVCIPNVMGRPKQHGVRGPHIYTEHAVPRTLAHAAMRFIAERA